MPKAKRKSAKRIPSIPYKPDPNVVDISDAIAGPLTPRPKRRGRKEDFNEATHRVFEEIIRRSES